MKNEAAQPKNPSAVTAKVISGSDSHIAKQGSVYWSGVLAQSVGSTMLWLGTPSANPPWAHEIGL